MTCLTLTNHKLFKLLRKSEETNTTTYNFHRLNPLLLNLPRCVENKETLRHNSRQLRHDATIETPPTFQIHIGGSAKYIYLTLVLC